MLRKSTALLSLFLSNWSAASGVDWTKRCFRENKVNRAGASSVQCDQFTCHLAVCPAVEAEAAFREVMLAKGEETTFLLYH